jgi:hypothetical protein
MTSIPNRKATPQEIVENQNVFASSLLLLYFDEVGSKGFYWHPVVIREQIEEIAGTKISEHNFQKLLTAIYTYITTDFFNKVSFFNVACQVFNNKVVSPSDFVTIADIYDMAWGVEEARIIIYSNEKETEQVSSLFSEQVASFIELNLLENSMLVIPKPLKYKDSVLVNEDLIHVSVPIEFQQDVLKEAFSFAKEVEDYVTKRKEALVNEFLRLPLNNGTVEGVVANILA